MINPRLLTGAAVHGYSNTALGTTGVAVAFPTGARGALVTVSAACFVGFRNSATLATFNDANYGSLGAGSPMEFGRDPSGGNQTHLHIAPITGTAVVTVCFF